MWGDLGEIDPSSWDPYRSLFPQTQHFNLLLGAGEISASLFLPLKIHPFQSFVSRTPRKMSSSIQPFTKARRDRLLASRSFSFLLCHKTPLRQRSPSGSREGSGKGSVVIADSNEYLNTSPATSGCSLQLGLCLVPFLSCHLTKNTEHREQMWNE